MRKFNARTVLFALLVIASLSSYIYLNNVSVHPQDEQIEEASQMENMDSESSGIVLPDVQLIKKALETGKRLIPAT